MKIALITGASSGIGAEFVKQISTKYTYLDEIWVVARRVERLEELKERFPNVKLRLFKCDVTKGIDLFNIKTALFKYRPNIKILVNSAGSGVIGRFDELSSDDNCKTVDLNCTALTKVTYMCLPYMKQGSAIINLASSAAFLPQPSFAVYAASKSYVLSLSMALSQELKERGILVTAVCPGPVKTEFFDNAEKYHSVKIYKKILHKEANIVVSKALWDVSHQRKVSVCGLTMTLFRILCKIVPHELLIKFIK